MAKEVMFVTFQDVRCPANRAWNQLQFARNLEEVHGEEFAERYFEDLTEAEKTNVLAIAARVLIKGEDFVIKELNQLAQGVRYGW